MDVRSVGDGGGVRGWHGACHVVTSPGTCRAIQRAAANPSATSFPRFVWLCTGWSCWCRGLSAYRRLLFARTKTWCRVTYCGRIRPWYIRGKVADMGPAHGFLTARDQQAAAIVARHRNRCFDIGQDLIAVVALACGISCLCVAFAGASTRAEQLHQVEMRKPRPTPQMMAPIVPIAPEENHSGMVYAAASRLVAKGGY